MPSGNDWPWLVGFHSHVIVSRVFDDNDDGDDDDDDDDDNDDDITISAYT